MNNKNFRYTKLGLISALLSLIPVFPIFSLFVGVGTAELIKSMHVECEMAYEISKWIFLVIVLASIIYFLLKLKNFETNQYEKASKKYFMIFSLVVYIFLNNFIFSYMLGAKTECYGQSDQVLEVIYSGPLSSLLILIIGVLIDIYRYKFNPVANKV